MGEQDLIDEKEKHEPWFREIAGFVGSGIGVNDAMELCIKIFTHKMSAQAKEEISARVNAVVDFEESGEFNPLT